MYYTYIFIFIHHKYKAAISKRSFLLSFEPNRNQTRTTKLTNKTKYITKMNRKAISIIKMLVIANPASPRWFSPKKEQKKSSI